MKLRNKKTGEINILKVDEDYFNIYKDDGEFVCPVTLKELNEGWEDYYEEPKEYWCIRENGVVGKRPYPIGIECVEQENRDEMREIGNYFETEEEAELAVRKLKAVKRLKDKGLRFVGWYDSVSDNNPDNVLFKLDEGAWETATCDDLDLLFSGGEE